MDRKMKMTLRKIVPLALALAIAGSLAAQPIPPEQDPPTRVARLSYMSGQVSFEPSSVNEWAPASLNYPLTTGDNLYTDPAGARAVLRVSRNSIRIAPGTNFQMVNLSDQVAQMSINSGAIDLKIRHIWDGNTWEVDTPNGAVTLLQAGEYRIDTDPNRNATMVTVRNGQAVVTSNNQSFTVYARQTAYVDANGAPNIVAMNPPDDFDQFGYTRDRIEDAPPPPYVSQYMTGYEDLASYGTWQPSPDYGYMWVPRVEFGWAPYHTGHWAWVGPWGWTWVDDSPWGFAPFHYGRWAYVNNYWGWVPGPVSVQPIYAPALVAFVGGGGFGIALGGGGIGAIGWFALGPREPFFPAYHVSNNYVRNVNITNTTITNITVINNYNNGASNNFRSVTYANQRVNGAVTAVPQTSFASGASVQRAAVRITPEQMRSVQVVAAAPVVPQRASVLGAGSNAGGPVARPPVNIAARPVIARIAPPPAPVRFEAQQQALQQNPGRPVAPQQLQTIRQATPTAALSRIPVKTVNPAQVQTITPQQHSGPAPAMNNQPPARPMVTNPTPAPAPRPAYNPPAPAPAPKPAYTPPPAAPRPAYTPPPPAPRPAYTPPAPAPAPKPAYTQPPAAPRPQNAPPPQVNKPQPPHQERPQAAAPKPAPRPTAKPKEEKPKDEKEKEKEKQ
jgi:hypothetical protein